MDPVLTSLLTTNQIGADGFNWWIGQVESGREDDPKKSGRYRVRIVGQHLKTENATPTSELPWANVMMPVTTPFSDGGVTGATAELRLGNWVIGFYLDNDKQKPIIMGSIGHTAGATTVQQDLVAPTGKTSQEFTTGNDPNLKPQAHRTIGAQDGKDPKTKANIDGGEPAAATSNEENGAPAIIAALRGKYSETNPIGSKTCVTVANPTCGTESNFSKQITNIIGDLLAANQDSGGMLGDFYISKINGYLYDKVSLARYHIGRVTRLVRSLMGRIQAELIKYIRKGIEYLVKAALGLNVPEEQKEKVPVAPKSDFDKVKSKGNVLKTVKKILDQVLQALGCAIEDLIDKLVQWLTDLLFGFIMDVFSPAACAIQNLVDGIINRILELIDGLIASVMGPLQSILSILGSPLNIVGTAIAKVMSFLGITCSGPSGKCGTQTVKCNDCGTDEDDDDFLDQLLKDIEEGDTGERFNCEESQDYQEDAPTTVIFVGGIPEEPTPERAPDGGISTPPGSIGSTETPDTFFPSTAEDPSNDPAVIPQFPDLGDGINQDEQDRIEEEIEDQFTDEPDDGELPSLPIDATGEAYYLVTANPTVVTEGTVITYTIRTTNVPNGTVLDYTLSGSTIIPSYIVGESLTGSFTIVQYDVVTEEIINEDGDLEEVNIPIGSATVTVQISDNDVLKDFQQNMRFTIDDTDAFADVTIVADLYSQIRPGYNPNFAPLPLVFVTSDKQLYYEGEDIIYTITTQNIPDGTRLSYVMYGDIVPQDFIQNDLEGTFVIRNGRATVTMGIAEDLAEEFDELVNFRVVGYDASTSVTIVGTAVQPSTTERTPSLDRPTTFTPITDDKGSIISVPIKDTGSRYQEPPFVIFKGSGFGATAIALLDENGFVSEIRVTRGGLGYKRNTATDNGLKCIIDSFTLISPGIKYKSQPTVYINGELGIAEAEIDSRGYVISVKILNRTKTYTSQPKVMIVGGGGAGALAIPNMVCLDPDDLATRGAVKIGTGKYIDCP